MPSPCLNMVSDDGELTSEASHEKWCEQLRAQTGFIHDLDPERVRATKLHVQNLVSQARSRRGHGPHDQRFQASEIKEIVDNWDSSSACPPDLTPRAAFKCRSASWMNIVWLVQDLCGPNFLACRPSLWRWSVLMALWKEGCPRRHKSFRLIFVKAQMGLLQEGLISKRLKHIVFDYLMPVQSGYWKGVEDPHLVLHELCSMTMEHKRQLWLVFADFKKAFPRTWRGNLLLLLNKGPRVLDGAFALLASVLELDEVHVW